MILNLKTSQSPIRARLLWPRRFLGFLLRVGTADHHTVSLTLFLKDRTLHAGLFIPIQEEVEPGKEAGKGTRIANADK